MEKGTKQESIGKNCEAESVLEQDVCRDREQTTKPKTTAVEKSTKKPTNTLASLFDVLDDEDDEEDRNANTRPAADSTVVATSSKPPADLFKAIFTDSEPSDEDDVDTDTEADTKAQLPINQSADNQLSMQIDARTLAVRDASPKLLRNEPKNDAPQPPKSDTTSDSEEDYGPAPPPPPTQATQQHVDDADRLRMQRSRQEALQRVIAQSVDATARADAEQELFEFVEKRTGSSPAHHKHERRHRHRRRHQDGGSDDGRRSDSDRTKHKRERKRERGHHERESRSSHSRRREKREKREKRKRSSGYDASDSDA